MNLKQFLAGLFRGHNADGELETVRSAARDDAQLIVGTYVVEFEAEAARILLDRQQRFLGLLPEGSVEENRLIDVRCKPTAVKRGRR
jgi:hypothetical protein